MSDFTHEYSYNRSDTPGVYLVNNSVRPTSLAKEIEAGMTGKSFRVKCIGDSLKILFTEDLSEEEESTLNNIISDHKYNG